MQPSRGKKAKLYEIQNVDQIFLRCLCSDYKDYTSLVNHCKSDCKKQKNAEYVVKTIKEYLHYEVKIC